MIHDDVGRVLVAGPLITPDAKRELVARVAESDLFRRAPRQREFLLYVADCTLNDRLEGVREQAIAENVFGRSPEQYDGDSIVRAEARNLRKRLEKYFETDGEKEPVAVVMPKGGYSIAFRTRAAETPALTETEAVLVRPVVDDPIALRSSTTGKRTRWVFAVLAAFALCLAAVLAVRYLRSTSPQATHTDASSRALPFSALFGSGRDTIIITSDTSFWQISWIANRRLTLDDFLTRSYPKMANLSPPDLIQSLNRFQYTDADETSIGASIMRQNAPLIGRTFLRSGHQLTMAEIKSANVILLGSPLSNPWAQLYSSRVNFEFDDKPGVGIILQNRSPKPGELSAYPGPDDARQNRTYARLAFIPAESDKEGHVLLVAGTTAEATQAAGEFLLDQSKLASTLRSIGVDPAGRPQFFELLFRATTFVGGVSEAELIGYRLHPYRPAK